MKQFRTNRNDSSSSHLFKNLFIGSMMVIGLVMLGATFNDEPTQTENPSMIVQQQLRSPSQAHPKNIEPAAEFSSSPIKVALTPTVKNDHQPRLKIDDFLSELKQQTNDYTTPNINRVLSDFYESHADSDRQLVADWVAESNKSAMGMAYHIADEFKKHGDDLNAYHWYHISAKKIPSPQVLYNLGEAELFGKGTSINYTRAKRNLYQSVRNQHQDAAYLLGVVYLSGLDTEANPGLAYQWFQKSIAQKGDKGYAEAGRMRELGYGVKQDKDRAIELYEQGAKLGDRYCTYRLNKLAGASGDLLNDTSDFTADDYTTTATTLLPVNFLFDE